jgi:hypothetical protein
MRTIKMLAFKDTLNNMKVIMKKSTLFLTGAIFIASQNTTYAFNEQAITVEAKNFLSMSTHLTHHSVASAHNIATLSISGIPSPCSSGLFYDTETNKDAHSILLAAYVGGQQINVGYDIDQNVTPWGANYCAVTQVRLLK